MRPLTMLLLKRVSLDGDHANSRPVWPRSNYGLFVDLGGEVPADEPEHQRSDQPSRQSGGSDRKAGSDKLFGRGGGTIISIRSTRRDNHDGSARIASLWNAPESTHHCLTRMFPIIMIPRPRPAGSLRVRIACRRTPSRVRISGASRKCPCSHPDCRAFHRLDENRQQRLQALAADPIRRLPDHNQRIADRIIINAARRPRSRASLGPSASEQGHRVLAMETHHRHELVQDARLLTMRPLA